MPPFFSSWCLWCLSRWTHGRTWLSPLIYLNTGSPLGKAQKAISSPLPDVRSRLPPTASTATHLGSYGRFLNLNQVQLWIFLVPLTVAPTFTFTTSSSALLAPRFCFALLSARYRYTCANQLTHNSVSGNADDRPSAGESTSLVQTIQWSTS